MGPPRTLNAHVNGSSSSSGWYSIDDDREARSNSSSLLCAANSNESPLLEVASLFVRLGGVARWACRALRLDLDEMGEGGMLVRRARCCARRAGSLDPWADDGGGQMV